MPLHVRADKQYQIVFPKCLLLRVQVSAWPPVCDLLNCLNSGAKPTDVRS